MSGNEVIIVFVAIIGIPICLWGLFWMPNARECGACGLTLNMNRQKTYHSLVKNKDVEVCKQCYENATPVASQKVTSQKLVQASIIGESNLINENLGGVKPNLKSMPQRANPLSAIGKSISVSEVLEEVKLNNCVWLDTETTGLSINDEIIELSICTHDKQVIFNSILRSKVGCTDQARAVHGITDEQIANGVPIESAKAPLLKLLEGKTIISFNADFDCKMLFQTIGLLTNKRFCVMKWSQSALDYERWPRLEKVCERLNINQSKAHRSLADTLTTIDVFNKLVDLTDNHKSLLRDFSLIDVKKLDKLENGETLFLSPNSNIFAFDCLMDRYGNEVIGIRSKALKRMLKKEGTRVFIKKSLKGNTLKVQYTGEPDMQLPISNEELRTRLDALKLKKISPNKYLNLKATVALSNIDKAQGEVIDGTYYFPSIAINEELYENLENLSIFHNHDRGSVAFIVKNPKNTMKRLFALGLQGYSSILKVVEHDEKVSIVASHLLEEQQITVLKKWDLDGEKSWSGDY